MGNVVVLELDGDYRKRITVRPSGTEPRIKFYLQWFEDTTGEDTVAVEKHYKAIQEHLESLAKELEGMLLK
jgi:phosphomannomutase